MGATTKNTVSDKAEKSAAAKILKERQLEQFANVNARGESIAECPLVPVGPAIFLAYNVKEESAIVLNDEDKRKSQKALIPYFTVIGIGATKTSFNLSNGIDIDYVDPANLVYSYTDDPNFEDIY